MELAKKKWLWLLSALLGFGVFLILFCVEENRRGERELKRCLTELRAEGEPLTEKELFPNRTEVGNLTSVPFFQDSYLAKEFDKEPFSHTEIALPKGVAKGKLGGFTTGKVADLQAWQAFFRAHRDQWPLPEQSGTPAQDVLAALGKWEGNLAQVSGAIGSNEAYWPIRYDKGVWANPPFGSAAGVAEIWVLRGTAFLENGETGKAAGDFSNILNLADSIGRSPTLVGAFVQNAMDGRSLTLLWQGIHRHAWSEKELQEIEGRLSEESALESCPKGLRGERLLFLNAFLGFKGVTIPKEFNIDDPVHSKRQFRALYQFRPHGWVDLDMAYGLRLQSDSIHLLELKAGKAPDDVFAVEDRMKGGSWEKFLEWFPHPLSYLMATPMYSPSFFAMAFHSETSLRLARLACFLERYRIRNGRYPENLSDIPDLPSGLDQEIVVDRPFVYRREGDSYRLYSVGWNRTDEGGKLALHGTEGDWVLAGP